MEQSEIERGAPRLLLPQSSRRVPDVSSFHGFGHGGSLGLQELDGFLNGHWILAGFSSDWLVSLIWFFYQDIRLTGTNIIVSLL